MAAASVLAGVDKLWERVLPELEDQEWRGEGRESNYSGVFRLVEARRLGMHLTPLRFRFWRFGRWMEVLVDDLIPTR